MGDIGLRKIHFCHLLARNGTNLIEVLSERPLLCRYMEKRDSCNWSTIQYSYKVTQKETFASSPSDSFLEIYRLSFIFQEPWHFDLCFGYQKVEGGFLWKNVSRIHICISSKTLMLRFYAIWAQSRSPSIFIRVDFFIRTFRFFLFPCHMIICTHAFKGQGSPFDILAFSKSFPLQFSNRDILEWPKEFM